MSKKPDNRERLLHLLQNWSTTPAWTTRLHFWEKWKHEYDSAQIFWRGYHRHSDDRYKASAEEAERQAARFRKSNTGDEPGLWDVLQMELAEVQQLIAAMHPELLGQVPAEVDEPRHAPEDVKAMAQQFKTLLGLVLAQKPELQYVDLDQIAAAVGRKKSSFEKLKNRRVNPLPDADIPGGGGKKDEWRWDLIKPWLEKEFNRPLQSAPRRLI